MHAGGQRSAAEDSSQERIADDGILEVQDSKHGNWEEPVVVESSEHVQFSVCFRAENAAIEHVEGVHEHKGLEHQREVLHPGSRVSLGVLHRLFRDEVILDFEHGWSCVQQNDEHDKLVNHLRIDLAPHGREDLASKVLRVDRPAEFSGMRGLGSQGHSGKRVHDQVDPEKLHNGEGRAPER